MVEPTHGDALFAWEHPSQMPVEADGWTVDLDAARHLASNVADNVRVGIDLVVSQFVVVPLFALVATASMIRDRVRGPRRLRPVADSPWWALGLVIILYTAGYLLTLVEGRYLWFAVLALVPLTAAAIDLPVLRPGLERTDPAYATWRLVGFGLLAALVAVQASVALRAEATGDRVAQTAERVVAADGDTAERIAGANVASADEWEDTSILCFHLGCTFVGVSGSATELREKADHYVVWHTDEGSNPPAPPDELGPLLLQTDELSIYATS